MKDPNYYKYLAHSLLRFISLLSSQAVCDWVASEPLAHARFEWVRGPLLHVESYLLCLSSMCFLPVQYVGLSASELAMQMHQDSLLAMLVVMQRQYQQVIDRCLLWLSLSCTAPLNTLSNCRTWCTLRSTCHPQ